MAWRVVQPGLTGQLPWSAVAAMVLSCSHTSGHHDTPRGSIDLPPRPERELPTGTIDWGDTVGAPDGASIAGAGGAGTGGGQNEAGGPIEDPEPPVQPSSWSGAVGSWCGPGTQRTLWLVANPEWMVCQARAEYLQPKNGELSDGFSVELPPAALNGPASELPVHVRRCSARQCNELPGLLSLDEYRADIGARGRLRIVGEDASIDFRADACPWDDYLPSLPEATRAVTGLRLHEVAVFQAVKIPIMRRLTEISERNAELVAGRAALLRAYVVPDADFQSRRVRARLTLVNQNVQAEVEETQVLESIRAVSSTSAENDLDSTFNFEIPPDWLRETTRYSIELLEDAPCTAFGGEPLGTRFPESATLGLGARAVGKVRIELVPIRVSNGETELLPDTSAAQLERLRENIVRLFPIADAEVTLRETPVTTEATNMVDVLNQLLALRDAEGAPQDLSYYGLVQFTAELRDYCAPACVLGAGTPNAQAATASAAVGIGYTGDEAARTFAHEMGHVYGREHSPCGVAGDPAYPYSRGGIGSWGYDLVAKRLVDPASHSDFMGYCAPAFVSDYTYSHLQTFITELNESAASSGAATAARWRTLILQAGRAPRWGLSRTIAGRPQGAPELADVYDVLDHLVDAVTVYRQSVPDAGVELVYVPDVAAPNRSLKVAGYPRHAYDAPITVRPLKVHQQ